MELYKEQLPFAKLPFRWEYIPSRIARNYRISDSKDDPMGDADTEDEAEAIVNQLNKDVP